MEKTIKDTSPLAMRLEDASFLDLPLTARLQLKGEFRKIPAETDRQRDYFASSVPWRIALSRVDNSDVFIALELLGDIVLGSNSGEEALDVNLVDWRGYEFGVSRRHLMLRPSRTKLYAIDLRSTNGTHVNGLPLGVGWAYAISDGDLITLGKLHVRVHIIQHPSAI